MKIQHLITAALTMLISSCSEKAEFDASGNFEATEVTLSAESSGKILSFDVEEGDTVEIGELLAKIDTVQLQLQKEQLIRQRSGYFSSVVIIQNGARQAIERKTQNRKLARRWSGHNQTA